MYWDPTGHWEVGDNDRSAAAQAQILEATKDYIDAKARGDEAGMEAAHQKAQDTRNGNVYQDNSRVSTTSIASDLNAVLNSQYVTQAARDDAAVSDMSFAGSTAARNDPAARAEQNDVIREINQARKASNVVSDSGTGNSNYYPDIEIKNDHNLIMGNTTIAAPMPWEITAPTMGISPKVFIPALIPFVIFWETPIICDDGYFEYQAAKANEDSPTLDDELIFCRL